MTHTELNELPHRTLEDLAKIPSVKLLLIHPSSFLAGIVTTVYDPVETADGWTGCHRMSRTGDFYPRRLFPKTYYQAETRS